MLLENGTLLRNRYRIEQVLRHEEMGAVYRATDLETGSLVAVTEHHILSVLVSEAGDEDAEDEESLAAISSSEEVADRFEKEARILASLDHPGVPGVRDFFDLAGQGQYLVMDYVEGEDLAQVQAGSGRFGDDEVIAAGFDLCDILEHLHSRVPPVIHRDIRPSNVRRTPEGRIVLVGFGVGREQLPGEMTLGAPSISPGYSPLEQYGGDVITDERSDIYSLGATLLSLATGETPRPATERALARGAAGGPQWAGSPSARVPEALGTVLAKAVALLPKDRYQTVGEFRSALRVLQGVPIVDEKVAAPPPAAPVAEPPLPVPAPAPPVEPAGAIAEVPPARSEPEPPAPPLPAEPAAPGRSANAPQSRAEKRAARSAARQAAPKGGAPKPVPPPVAPPPPPPVPVMVNRPAAAKPVGKPAPVAAAALPPAASASSRSPSRFTLVAGGILVLFVVLAIATIWKLDNMDAPRDRADEEPRMTTTPANTAVAGVSTGQPDDVVPPDSGGASTGVAPVLTPPALPDSGAAVPDTGALPEPEEEESTESSQRQEPPNRLGEEPRNPVVSEPVQGPVPASQLVASQIIAGTPSGNASVEIAWAPSEAPEFTSYEVYYSRPTSDLVVPVFIRSGKPIRDREKTRLDIAGLRCETPYEFKVRTVGRKGAYVESAPFQVATGLCAVADTLVVSPRGDARYLTIEQALDAATRATGVNSSRIRRILLRPGKYVLNGTIRLPYPVMIAGIGPRDNVVIENSGGPCFIVDATPVTFRGLTIRSAGDRAVVVRGQTTFEDVDLSGGGACLDVDAATSLTVRGSRLHDSRGPGVRLAASAKGLIENCVIAGNAIGILLQSQSTLTISRSQVLRSRQGDGIVVQDMASLYASGCDISDNRKAGVALEGGFARLSDSRINKNRWYAVNCADGNGSVNLNRCTYAGNFPSDVHPLCDKARAPGVPQ